MNKRRVGKRVANQKQNSRTLARNVIPRPQSVSTVPALGIECRLTKTFRYTAIAAVGPISIYVDDILGAISMATTTTNVNSLIGAFKLRSLVAYDISGASDVSVSSMVVSFAQLSAGPGLSGPSQSLEVISTPLYPGVLSCIPPKGSVASFWQGYLSDLSEQPTLFQLTLPIGAILDLTIEMVLLQAGALSYSQSVTGPVVVGDVYSTYLDNVAETDKLSPVGRTLAH